jgi:hypothetical protein
MEVTCDGLPAQIFVSALKSQSMVNRFVERTMPVAPQERGPPNSDRQHGIIPA